MEYRGSRMPVHPAFAVGMRHSTAGEEKLDLDKDLDRIAEEENLIVKGDNLKAINVLRPKLLDRVRLIYIDPPYNTGKGSLSYSDSRSREEWLQMMKERLNASKPLLVPGGVICIQISSREMAYLKVLCDQVYGEENYVNTITVQAATTASFRAVGDCPVNVAEYILIYSSDRTKMRCRPVYIEAGYSPDYSQYIEYFDEGIDRWKLVSVNRKIYEMEGVAGLGEFRKRYGAGWKAIRNQMKAEFCREYRERIVSLNTLQNPAKGILEMLKRSQNDPERVFVLKRDEREPMYFYKGRSLAFYSKKFREVNGEMAPTQILTNIWTDLSFLTMGTEGGVRLLSGKKPERLAARLIQLFAPESDDLVMDFFLGSGTTCAVAHKMGRRYVGVELQDYGKNDCVVRLKNVIAGETGGISPDVGWSGGGAFVCLELI